MPSLTDVLNSLVATCAASKPAGLTVSYFPGFPIPENLKAVLKAGNAQVSVFPNNVVRKIKGYVLEKQIQVVEVSSGQTVFLEEVSRQIRQFQIHVWANSPDKRDSIGEAIKVALDSINTIPLAYGLSGRHLYVSEIEDDKEQAANIYHRVYTYSVEYSTTKQQTEYNACNPRILNKDGQVFSPGSDSSILVTEIE